MLKLFLLQIFRKHASKWLVLFVDVFLLCISFILAYAIRFDFRPNFDILLLEKQLLFIIIIGLFSFFSVGSFKGIIRHTTIKDAYSILKALSIYFCIAYLLIKSNAFFGVLENFKLPGSILLIHYFLAIFYLIFSRFVFKYLFELVSSELHTVSNVLIYGAGDSGIITYNVLSTDKNKSYRVVGFLDDDKNKSNKQIDRTKIYAPEKINKKFLEDAKVSIVIISIQRIDSEKLLEITDYFLNLEVLVKIVPPIINWIDGNLEVNQIKNFTIDDLLKRPVVLINNPNLENDIKDKVILVTGAAGSIGSEISRQLSILDYQHLILLDQAESPLYDLQQEFNHNGVVDFTAIVANVRDQHRIEEIFNKFKPHKVFHAAAYKHVPLMEENPYEAVKVNVYGTKVVADLSIKYHVEKFVMISSDKAVNPTNVMGASKRTAELYTSSLYDAGKTKFITTRFGNVLGSSGSVIPLFKKQIESGGPLTVTHKDITRYFMTIPEACGLVLDAGTMGEGGEIFIFDMGKSVKIIDLAKRMIKLSGLKFPEEMDIIYTGLRPGEKLYEELLANGEKTQPTHHHKIMIAKCSEFNPKKIKEDIIGLCDLSVYSEASIIVSKLKEIVPEYKSQNSSYEELDKHQGSF
jgi:FlaA1/EpsC-like NDP-sugar epimerase